MAPSKPLIMGALMGPLMLWMLHGQLTGDSTMSGAALIVFILLHLLIVFIFVAGAVFAARLSPKARKWMGQLHRPSLCHMMLMIAGAIASAGVVHVFIHGLI